MNIDGVPLMYVLIAHGLTGNCVCCTASKDCFMAVTIVLLVPSVPWNTPLPILAPTGKWSENFHDFLRSALQKEPRKRPSASDLLRVSNLQWSPHKCSPKDTFTFFVQTHGFGILAILCEGLNSKVSFVVSCHLWLCMEQITVYLMTSVTAATVYPFVTNDRYAVP